MQDLVIMQYLGSNICFTQDGWINATETAKALGKDIRGYTRSEQYKGYSQALAQKLNCVNSAQLQKTIEGRNGGTFLHPKLAVDFARWISPEFAIWCDEVIAEKLNTPQKPQSMLEMLAEGFAQMAKLEQTQTEQNNRILQLEAKTTTINEEFYSLAGFYRIKSMRWDLGQSEAIQTGRQAKILSAEMGYAVGKVYDAKFGEVNTYHVRVLEALLCAKKP